MARREPRPYHVTIIRFTTPDGRRCSKSTPGAVRVKTHSDTYYGRVPNETGKPVPMSLETTDLGEAWVRLRARLKEAHQRRAGISDQFTEHALRPWSVHVAAWLATVKAKGTTTKQVELIAAHVEALRELAGWQKITDMSSSSCTVALGRLQNTEGRSAQTRNHYLTHCKQFVRFLVEDGRLRSNPLLSVRPVNVETDRRHDRRCPTDDEVARLMEYLDSPRARVRCGMTGPRRALAYRLAMATGYRADEVRSLTRESFDLERAEVTVVAAYSKHRRNDTQQLPPWLVEQLREWFAAGGECWGAFPHQHPGRLLKADLEAAGIPYTVPGKAGEPLFFDFHAMRHHFCTWAANLSGISPRTLLALTRHSSVELAMRTYSHMRIGDVRSAVEQLPEPGKQPPPPGKLQPDLPGA